MGQQEKPVIGQDFDNYNNDLSYKADRENRIPGTLPLQMVPRKDRLAAGCTFFHLSDDGRVDCGLKSFFTQSQYKKLIDTCKEFDVEKWRSIVAIDAGRFHTVGLCSNGTVVATGNPFHGQCYVHTWKNITAICTSDSATFGLRQDGTVVTTDTDWDTSSLRNVTGIVCSFALLLGLHADGTLTAISRKGRTPAFCGELQTWRDIVAAAANDDFIVGLHADGTVTVAGDDSEGARNVSSWRNIISVRCSRFHTIGLRSDGTVVATGWNENGQCNVSTWRDIVAIAAGESATYGLRADGTVLSTAKAFQNKNVHSTKGVAPSGPPLAEGPDGVDGSAQKASRKAE